MARSRRKNPGFPYCSGHMKPWKVQVNRRFRRKAKQMIHTNNFERVPLRLNEIETLWSSPSDGRIYAYSLVRAEKNPDERTEWLYDYWNTWRRK